MDSRIVLSIALFPFSPNILHLFPTTTIYYNARYKFGTCHTIRLILERIQLTSISQQKIRTNHSSTSMASILSLPYELLHEIFIRLDDPLWYLTIHSVCRRFHSIASSPPTRQSFASRWFLMHCNDEPGEGPSLIEYTARYIRCHCKHWNDAIGLKSENSNGTDSPSLTGTLRCLFF